MKTVSYTAKSRDSRCKWWSKKIPFNFDVSQINLDDKQSLSALPFLKAGSDLELDNGDSVINSEERHHRKYRGYDVKIIICENEKLVTVFPNSELKSQIKTWASNELWNLQLKNGSGDVAACLRFLIAYRNGFRVQEKTE